MNKMLESLIEQFTPYPHTGWSLVHQIVLTPLPTAARRFINDGEAGKGANSVVYYALDPDSKMRYVIKAAIADNFPRVHKNLARYNLAPQIYMQIELERRDEHLFLVLMNPIKMSLGKYLSTNYRFNIDRVMRALKCLIEKKLLINFFHGDLHTQNIIFLMDGSLGLIDFEFSRNEPLTVGPLDLIPLIGDLKFSFDPRQKELAAKVVDYVNHLFNIQLDMTRIDRKSQGGFEYRGSTKVFDTYDFKKFSRADIAREFPSFTPPLIE